MRTIESKAAMGAPANAIASARRVVRLFAGAAGFCLLTAFAAQVRIPVPGTDVPITLQVLAVLLAGMSLRPGPAAGAMLAYVALGTLGLPFFAPGSAGLMGPTGGYILGFAAAAWLVSVCRGSGHAGFGRLLAAGAVGLVVLFALGVGWRIVWLGGDVGLALATGLFPFAAKALVELLLAVAITVKSPRCRGTGAWPGGL